MGKAVINRLFLLFLTVLTILAGRISLGFVLSIVLLLVIFKIAILTDFLHKLLRKDDLKGILNLPDEFFYALSIIFLYLICREKPIFMTIGWGIMGFGNFFVETFSYSGNKLFSKSPKVAYLLRIIIFTIGSILSVGGILIFIPHNLYLDQPIIFWWMILVPSSLVAAVFREIKGLIHPYLITALIGSLMTWLSAEVLLHGHFFLPVNIWSGGSVVVIFVTLSYLSGKIDLIGSIAGGIIALGLFLGDPSWGSLGLLFVFFIAGTFVSSWKKDRKKALKIEQENEGKRSINNALSNGGIAGLLGFLSWLFPEQAIIFAPMLAASLAAACSDTFSSELGNVYGKTYRNILTFQKGERGKDGVISLEGSLLGIFGSAIIALIYGLWFDQYAQAIVVFVAGYAGNLMDSFLGATLQKTELMNNDTVNVGCTLFAALVAYWLLGIGI